MTEKNIDDQGRIANIEDAHALAHLENEARDTDEIAKQTSDALNDLENPEEFEAGLVAEEIAHEEAAKKRHLADAALENYTKENS